MIRVVLGRHDAAATLAYIGTRILLLGDSLLVDGKRVARRCSWGAPGVWLDEHGRGWQTIDFEVAHVHRVSGAGDDEEDVPVRPEVVRADVQQLEQLLKAKKAGS